MDNWIESIEAVSSGVGAVNAAVGGVVNQFLAFAEQYNVAASQTEVAVGTLTQRISGSSTGLVGCLTDLATMSRAMKDAMDANPEEAGTLVFSLFNIFLKQLTVYYKDACESLEQAELAFRKSKPSVGCRSGSVPVTDAMPLVTRSPTVSTSPSEAGIAAKKQPTEKKKKKAQEASRENALIPREQQLEGKAENVTPTVGHSPALGDGSLKEKPTARRGTASAAAKVVMEPAYLHVGSTVEEALGRLVLSSRPNVFTAPEVIERRSPITTYYIALPTPGCLGSLLLKNYISLGEDIQADLMCDILRTDCVEVEPFDSPDGEIVVEDPSDLRGIPACGWRLGTTEDRQQMLYTLYVLVDRGGTSSRSLLIQESLLVGGEREEVLHIITALSEAPQFAKVTVRGFSQAGRRSSSPTKKYTSERLSAIVNITKDTYERNGFFEVKEDEVRAEVQRRHHELQVLREEELLTKSGATETAFQGTVELASLDQPSEHQGWGLSDVAKGAVRGAAAVVLAPVSVGKAVGTAVLGVSGVTGAIKQQTESLFRKSFPQLASEDIIETFSCALVDDGNPIPKQGFIFITPRWLCFQAALAHANFSLEWDEIRDVQKQRTVKLLENAIIVSTHLGGSYFLTSFVQRDQAYNVIMKQWLRK
ncbi:GRAM domain containing protein [Trypanosoma grayi]|uniref:GRAM domain containing protein n=1 Tax=Trypanosoma grayi TaxID=71804 RepID=UPI0004F4947F|nr:GRAM domain containing protein [Trypanosoma grayi]KEG14866.1 GRAM domain containing protein [Trypanosoma grayi]